MATGCLLCDSELILEAGGVTDVAQDPIIFALCAGEKVDGEYPAVRLSKDDHASCYMAGTTPFCGSNLRLSAKLWDTSDF